MLKRLHEIIENTVEKAVSHCIEELNKRIDALKRESDVKDGTIAALRQKIQQAEEKVSMADKLILQQDNKNRLANLTFSGLEVVAADVAADPGTSSSRIVNSVVKLCNEKLNCVVSADDFSSAYSLPIKSHDAGATQKQIIVVGFVRQVVRDKVYAARVKLAGFNRSSNTKIYINEDLPLVLYKLCVELRYRLKITKKQIYSWDLDEKQYILR